MKFTSQTVSTTCAFFLAMMCFPEAQEKAQKEIERVIGNERLPTLSDIDDLDRQRFLKGLCENLLWASILDVYVSAVSVACIDLC